MWVFCFAYMIKHPQKPFHPTHISGILLVGDSSYLVNDTYQKLDRGFGEFTHSPSSITPACSSRFNTAINCPEPYESLHGEIWQTTPSWLSCSSVILFWKCFDALEVPNQSFKAISPKWSNAYGKQTHLWRGFAKMANLHPVLRILWHPQVVQECAPLMEARVSLFWLLYHQVLVLEPFMHTSLLGTSTLEITPSFSMQAIVLSWLFVGK